MGNGNKDSDPVTKKPLDIDQPPQHHVERAARRGGTVGGIVGGIIGGLIGALIGYYFLHHG